MNIFYFWALLAGVDTQFHFVLHNGKVFVDIGNRHTTHHTHNLRAVFNPLTHRMTSIFWLDPYGCADKSIFITPELKREVAKQCRVWLSENRTLVLEKLIEDTDFSIASNKDDLRETMKMIRTYEENRIKLRKQRRELSYALRGLRKPT